MHEKFQKHHLHQNIFYIDKQSTHKMTNLANIKCENLHGL